MSPNINLQDDQLKASLYLRMDVEGWSLPLHKCCQFYACATFFCLTACLAPVDSPFRPMTIGHWCAAGSVPVAAPPTCFGSRSALSGCFLRCYLFGRRQGGHVPTAA